MALKEANKEVAQAEANYEAAEQNLILRVAQAYFNVLTAVDNLEANQASLEAIARQLDQANKRFEVGLIAITDVEDAKAARDSAAAAVIAAKRTLATSEDQLQEITGQKYDQLAKPGIDMPLKSPDPSDEGRWVNMSLEQNLTLISSRLQADIARDNVRVAFGGHLPTLDIVAGRSYQSQGVNEIFASQPFNYNTYFNDRQIGLQLTVPLFSGGLTQSKVRQAQYQWIAAKEGVVQSSRATERQARDSYLGVISGIARVQSLRQALESNQTALKATEAGYEVGTRTSVDVLNARKNLVQAQTDFSGSRYDYIVSVLQLRLAAGNLDRAELTEINTLLSTRRAHVPGGGDSGDAGADDPGPRGTTPPPPPPAAVAAGRTPLGAYCASSSGSISSRSLASAPRLLSTHSRPCAPMVARAAGSASSSLTRARSPAASRTTSAAPRAISSRAMSAPLKVLGPVSTGTPSAAGSSRLWPPTGTRLPPTNATSAAA